MFRVWAFVCFNLCAVSWADQKDFFYERYLDSQNDTVETEAGTERFTFSQKINPADPKDERVFAQRYYVNENFAKDQNSPVLFYLCGEAACTEKNLQNAVRTHAKKLGAYLVALEHRYYGESQPFPTLTTENLKYLTTENALKDAAAFQTFLTDDRRYRGPWIVIGGSYPGSLAAYYRANYPKLVVGALASSGPVMAKENFEEYDRHVATEAGPECLANIRKVVAIADEAFNDPKQMLALKEKFAATTLTNDYDFIYLLADMAALAVQYGYKEKFCDSLKKSDPLDGYAKFTKDIYDSWGMDATSGSVQGAMNPDPKVYASGIGARAWFYQSCTEYGYWQNAYRHPALSARSAKINPAYHREACRRLFQIDKPVDTTKINETLYVPLLDKKTSRIFFTNGSQDPWMNLSIAKLNANDSNPNTEAYLIEQSAHCADLRAPGFKDSKSLQFARERFQTLAVEWTRR